MRRVLALLVIASPSAALVGAGCSSREPTPPVAEAGPPGTFGAEVTVTILGAGRVVSYDGTIDCPGRCATRRAYADPVEAGGRSLALEAMPAAGVAFEGFTFDPSSVGTRGTGSDRCSPIFRPGATLDVPSTQRSIELPLGELEGTVAGAPDECRGKLRAPLAYTVIASFGGEADSRGPERDAAPDSPAVVLPFAYITDGGEGLQRVAAVDDTTLVVEVTKTLTRPPRLIAFSTTTKAVTVVADDTPGLLAMDGRGQLAFQLLSTATIGVVRMGDSGLLVEEAPTFVGFPICGSSLSAGITADATKAYCRDRSNDRALHAWDTTASPFRHEVVHLLPLGNAIAVDATGMYVHDREAETLLHVPLVGDGGVPSSEVLVADVNSPRQLAKQGPWLAWLDNTIPHVMLQDGGSHTTLPNPISRGLVAHLVPDRSRVGAFWLGVNDGTTGKGAILYFSAPSASAVAVASDVDLLAGLTATSTHAYWTSGGAAVYRAARPTP